MPDFESEADRAQKTIQQRGLADSSTPVLLMVSGGSDSTALAYIAMELRGRGVIGPVGIMHLNHNLRGAASDGDARFVEGLAKILDVPLFLYSVDVGAKADEEGGNLEAVARRERYGAAMDALEKLCLSEGIPVSEGRIFTAHTRNDRVENFFMRSIVGTGPGGFRSMLYSNGAIARPLMDIEREELRDYLRRRQMDFQASPEAPLAQDESGMPWREDATNAHTDQFRGYVRHEIVPRALDRNPKLFEVLCRTMNLIADEDDMLDSQAYGIVSGDVEWMQGRGRPKGCLIGPGFAKHPVPLQRRAVAKVLQEILGPDARLETRSIEAVLAGFGPERPVSGYTANIQGDLAISANKRGLRIEPMSEYRFRRKGKR